MATNKVRSDWRDYFGIYLKLARRNCEVTQDSLAKTVGKSRDYIRSIEGGRIVPPDLEMCEMLSAALSGHFTTEEIYGWSREARTPKDAREWWVAKVDKAEGQHPKNQWELIRTIQTIEDGYGVELNEPLRKLLLSSIGLFAQEGKDGPTDSGLIRFLTQLSLVNRSLKPSLLVLLNQMVDHTLTLQVRGRVWPEAIDSDAAPEES